MNTKPKIVVIGGGNGTAKVISAFKHWADAIELSAVSAMSDSGGSTGALRRAFHIPPTGDIMRMVVALSKYDHALLREIFYKNRIQSLPVFNAKIQASRGPNIGNLLLTFITQFEGDFVRAVRALEEALNVVGHAYPATLDQNDLVVELSNGAKVVGEENIDRPTYDRNLKIKRAWLEPGVQAYEPACELLESADYIVLSPGSLYCSIIAALLPKGIREAIGRSRARLSYVAGNAIENIGETGPDKLSDIITTLESYLPRPLDRVFYNNHVLTEEERAVYQRKGWGLIAIDENNIDPTKLYCADFEKEGGGLSDTKLYEVFKQYASRYYNETTGKLSQQPLQY